MAARALLRHPASTLLIIGTLAIGISVNTVVFSLINGLLLKPKPFGNADELAWIWAAAPGDPHGDFSEPDLRALREAHPKTLNPIVAEGRLPLAMQTPNGAEQIWSLIVSDNYFSAVGVTPVRGRTFNEADRGQPAVVVSAAFWSRLFGDDTSLAGRTVTLQNQTFAIAGVLPDGFRGFSGLYMPEVWVPLSSLDLLGLQSWKAADRRWLVPAGRLVGDVNAARVNAELSTISARVLNERAAAGAAAGGTSSAAAGAPASGAATAGGPATNRPERPARRLAAGLIRDGNPELDMLRSAGAIALGAVGLVLLLACFNVTGLLLARASERQREMGVRAALGASHGRLVRQLVTESLLLAAIAGVATLVIAYWSHDLLAAFSLPSPIPQDVDVSLDWRIVAFTGLLALAAGVLPGLAPAWHVRGLDLLRALKDDGRAASGPPPRLRRGLLLIEIAGSTCLLAIAILFADSMRRAATMDLGFETTNALVLQVNPGVHGHEGASAVAFVDQVLERLRATPGVRAAAPTYRAPGGIGAIDREPVAVEGEGAGAQTCTGSDCPRAAVIRAGIGYFAALRIPLIAGDDARIWQGGARDQAVIISDRLAAQLFRDRSPIGAWIVVGDTPTRQTRYQVMGVAREVNYLPTPEDQLAEIYRLLPSEDYVGGLSIVIGTQGDPAAIAPAVRAAIRAVDRDVPIARLQTMTAHLELARWPSRTLAGFSLTCALIAVALATVGLFALVHRSVSQRLREFGLRSALGASPHDLRTLVLREGVRLTLPGVAAGLLIALMTGYVAQQQLSRISIDADAPWRFAIVATLQIVITLAACLLPARRAARVDPLTVLRSD